LTEAQHGEQINRHWITSGPRPPRSSSGNEDRQRRTSGHALASVIVLA
jgi:hypothetical protein